MAEYKSFLKTVGGNEGDKCRYTTRLDTYGCGCAHDCNYCYARHLLEFRGLWNAEEPSVADITKIEKKLDKIPRGTILRLGGMTDCFQPLEKERRITFQLIQKLNARRIGYLIVTKSAIVADPEYRRLYDRKLAHIQITITTTDNETAAKYEKASPPSKRLDALLTLQREGFDVALRLSLFVPELVDFDALNPIHGEKILVGFLRANGFIRKAFPIDYSEYTVKQNGYWHRPLEKKIQYLRRIRGFRQISVCEDEDEAYKYWHDHFNPNPDDCCNLRKGR